MSKTRDARGREVMGWLQGGYQTLIDALERADPASSAARSTPAPRSTQIAGAGPRADGLVVDGRFRPFDYVLCTLAPPQARARARRRELAERAPPDHCRYLGVVCLLLRTRAERQPVLPPQHHRPARPADDGRRDDARRRSGARRRSPDLRLQVRRPGPPDHERPAGRASRRDYLGYARTIFPDLRDDEILDSRRPARAGHRARAPDRRREAPARDVPGRRASRSRRPRTCTPRSSAARPSSASPSASSPGILERLAARAAGGGMTSAPSRQLGRSAERASRRASAPTRSRSCALALFVDRARAPRRGAPGATSDSDTGYDLVAGERVADGELPYGDFVYYYGPLAPCAAGLVAADRRADGIDGRDRRSACRSRSRSSARRTCWRGRRRSARRRSSPPRSTAAVAFIPEQLQLRPPAHDAATLGMLVPARVCCSASRRYAATGRSRWLVAAGPGARAPRRSRSPSPRSPPPWQLLLWLVVPRTARQQARPRSSARRRARARDRRRSSTAPFLTAAVGPHRLFFENLYPRRLPRRRGRRRAARARMPMTLESFVDGRRRSSCSTRSALRRCSLAAAATRRRPGRMRRALIGAAVAVGGRWPSSAALVNPEALRHGLQFAYGWIPAGARSRSSSSSGAASGGGAS